MHCARSPPEPAYRLVPAIATLWSPPVRNHLHLGALATVTNLCGEGP
jgi:hypothetical protein